MKLNTFGIKVYYITRVFFFKPQWEDIFASHVSYRKCEELLNSTTIKI
jgi:hypothetical protein